MDSIIKSFLEDYKENDDMSIKTFFKMALIYQLGRIADALENEIRIRGDVDTYEQNN